MIRAATVSMTSQARHDDGPFESARTPESRDPNVENGHRSAIPCAGGTFTVLSLIEAGGPGSARRQSTRHLEPLRGPAAAELSPA